MARRVNKKFLIILTCIIVGGGVAMLVAGKLLFQKSPDDFIAAGDNYMQAGDYEMAIRNYLQAHSKRSSDPSILVKVGDAFEARSIEEPAYVGKERAAWNQALESQTDYIPALERLFAIYRDDAEAAARPEIFDRVRDIGRRLMNAKPDDLEVKAYVLSIPVRRMAAGIVVPDFEMDEAIGGLEELRQDDPSLPEPPFWIAQAKTLRAIDRQRSGYANEARRLLEEAAALFDITQTDQVQNAPLHLRAHQVFTTLARLEPDADKQQRLRDRAQKEIDHAREVAQPEGERFIDIHMAAAQQALGAGDRDGAERILRELMKARPDDQPVRLMLARLLGSQAPKRAEAIALLSEPVKPADRAYKTRQYELVTLLEQTGLRLDAYGATADAAERDAAGKIIETNLQRLDNSLGETPELLRLHGRWAMGQGDITQAIQQLNRAVNLLAQNNRPKDYDLMYLLARAYVAGNQTGQAKTLLNEIVVRFPSFPAARLLLAQLLLRENAIADAQQQLEALEQLMPGTEEVQRLRLAVLKGSNQDEQAKDLYSQMPETTDAEQRAKAQVALALGELAEASRLLETIHATSPADANVIRSLAQVYVTLNDRDRARELVDRAQKANPDNPRIALLQKSLHDASPQELIENIPDEFTRELRRFELAAAQQDNDKALTHLKKAEALQPENTQVLNLMFQYHLGTRDWETATTYMDRLSKANADHAHGATYRFRLVMAQGKVEEGITIARDLTSNMGEFAQSWLLLGQALQAAGRYDEAASRYAMALEKQSENLDAYRGIIQCYYAMNQSNDARRYIEQGRRVFPNDAGLRELQVQYELNYGDPEQAIIARETSMQADPENPQNWLTTGQAYLRAAQVRAGQDDEPGARKWIDKARALFTDAIAKWPDEPHFYGLRAEVALSVQQTQEGLDALHALAEREQWKERAEPQLMLGEYHARVGNIDEAEKALRLALRRSDNAPQVQLKLAMLLAQTNRLDQALVVLETNADDPRVRSGRISLLMEARRFAEAEKLITAALDKNPDDPELAKNLAAIYLNTNRTKQAIERLQLVLDQNPRDAAALRFMGLIHVMNNDPDQAISTLISVRERNPDDVDARYYLARAYQQKNDLDNAARELDAALKVQPLNKVLRMQLVNLYSTLRRWGEAERLIRDVRAMSVYAQDPDWAQAEAAMWAARGDTTRAVAAIQQAITFSPQDVRLVQQYLDILLNGRAYQQVLDETSKILAAGQQPWWVYQYRGSAYRRLDKKEEALAEFDKAMNTPEAAASPDIATAVAQAIAREIGVDETLERLKDRIDQENRWRLFAVYLHQARGDISQSILLLNQVLEDYDNLSSNEQDTALRLAGLVYLNSSSPDGLEKAHDAYIKLLKKYPNDLAALNNMACLLADRMNRPQQALVYSEQAYRLMQQSGQVQPLILDTYGWTLVLSGRVEEGIALLQQALERQRFPDGYYHLAIGYLKQQNPQEARRHLGVAMEMIQQAEKNQQAVDPLLKQQIQDAIAQTDQMLKDKEQAVAR